MQAIGESFQCVWRIVGSPVFLELHEGKLRLIVGADINQEEPTHFIDLNGA